MTKPSARDVAAYANVSTATVSHVLNGTRRVNKETADKVMNAIEALQYKPNYAARNLRTGKQRTIAFIVPDISNHFFSSLVEQIEDALFEHGYHLVVANTKERADRELEHLRYFTSGVADGLILASALDDCKQLKGILLPSFPAVFVDRLPKNLLWDSITISSKDAVIDAVNCLCAGGHNKIGYITCLPHLSTSKERLDSFIQALEKNGLAPCDDLVCTAAFDGSDMVDCMERLIAAGCSSIVISNGLLTFEAQQYLWKTGRFDSVKLVGFRDDYFFSAGCCYISKPVDLLGSRAVEQIIKRINGNEEPVKEIVLNCSFVNEK